MFSSPNRRFMLVTRLLNNRFLNIDKWASNNFLLVLATRWLITESPESCQRLGRLCDWSTDGKHKQKVVRVEGP